MIVVDTDVIAYLLLPGPLAARAESWFRSDPDWVAPVLWRSEFLNVLAGYLRRKQLTFDEARNLHRLARSLLSGGEHEIDAQRVLELVVDSDCSAYDCEFVSIALRLDVQLLTADRQLLKAFPQHTVAFSAT